MKKLTVIILITCLVICLINCVDGSNATRILNENGYTNVTITGYNFFACAKDDTLHTGFSATSPSGNKINGTVCSGLIFKNSTIRFQ